MLPVLATDQARALLAAGLAEDAAVALDGVIAAFRRQRLDQNLGEAELNRAQAAQRPATWPPPGGGRGWRCGGSRPGATTAWAALAGLTRLRAAFAAAHAAGRGHARIAAQALRVAGRLRAHGLPRDAALAELIAARAFTAASPRGSGALPGSGRRARPAG